MSGAIVMRDPAKLREHEDNHGIYGDDADDDLIESVRRNGVLQPLLILRDDTLVSGHRRRDAAVKAGRDEVPCLVNEEIDPADRLAVKELLLEENRYRNKTNEQKAAEVEAWKEIEAAKAKTRQAHGKTGPGKALGESFRQASKRGPRAVDKAAEKVGWSGRTAEKAEKVKSAIATCEKAGRTERAETLRTALNRSVNAAYKLLNGEADADTKRKRTETQASAADFLRAAEKSLGALQGNLANARRAGAKMSNLDGYFKGIFDAIEKGRKSL